MDSINGVRSNTWIKYQCPQGKSSVKLPPCTCPANQKDLISQDHPGFFFLALLSILFRVVIIARHVFAQMAIMLLKKEEVASVWECNTHSRSVGL